MRVLVEDLENFTSVFNIIDDKVSQELPVFRGNTLRFNTDTAQ